MGGGDTRSSAPAQLCVHACDIVLGGGGGGGHDWPASPRLHGGGGGGHDKLLQPSLLFTRITR